MKEKINEHEEKKLKIRETAEKVSFKKMISCTIRNIFQA
jgi:hypothetical protein